LQVNSGATAPEWATISTGGMTLINTGGTTLTGASVTLSSIPQIYINLYLIIVGAVQAADGYDGCGVQINGDTGSNRHLRSGAYGSSVVAFNDTEWKLVNAQDNSTSTSLFTLLIPSYTNTTSWKIGKGISVGKETNTPTSATIRDITFVYNQTAAVSSLVLSAQGSTFSSGTAYLYGVK
jgi:hypothetical protein